MERSFSKTDVEINIFREKICNPVQKVDPCFMTGKACVYSEIIDVEKKKFNTGFMIMPFRPNIKIFFENCLKPFIEKNYEVDINTANQVRRPGVIICEGICKRIQETNFIVADISIQNPNVYYELGLAYGLGQKIILVSNKEKPNIDLPDGVKIFHYSGLDPLSIDGTGNQFPLSQYFWTNNHVSRMEISDSESIVLFDKKNEIITNKENNAIKQDDQNTLGGLKRILNELNKSISNVHNDFIEEDIYLSIEQQIASSVGIAIDKIYNYYQEHKEDGKLDRDEIVIAFNYLKRISKLSSAKNIAKNKFNEIKNEIDKCYCFIVRTGRNCNPMSYFWLGYSHAIGKNVIPITATDDSGMIPEDLAFDIRAQRHITFIKNKPDLLEPEIFETLNLMIKNDYKAWSKKRFWNKIINVGGEISIFTGALHSVLHDREMIGDWDLLTVSELTSFLGRHQYRFTIEPPVYPPETAYLKDASDDSEEKRFKNDYITKLEKMMEGKNCIVIASPDVNPLTEILLSKLYSKEINLEKYLFKQSYTASTKNKTALIACKEKDEKSKMEITDNIYTKTGRAFYKEEKKSENKDGYKTGFIYGQKKCMEVPPRYSETESSVAEVKKVYGNLVIMRNPIQNSEGKYIIILNGVGGPATFALTQVLTGNDSSDFLDYEEFNPHIESENILNQTLIELNEEYFAIECIIEVEVGKGKAENVENNKHSYLGNETILQKGSKLKNKIFVDNISSSDKDFPKTSDWRKIKRWGFEKEYRLFEEEYFRKHKTVVDKSNI